MNILTFNGIEFQPIKQQNQIWLTASQLAEALEYSDVRSVTKIYQRNADEFTLSMTEVVKLTTTKDNNNLQTSTRIFSLRGCHLVAMLSKTKIAKQFRQWVLDILDKEVGQPVQVEPKLSDEQCYQIRKAIKQKCLYNGMHYQTIYNALYDKFHKRSYKDILASDFETAMDFIRAFRFDEHEELARSAELLAWHTQRIYDWYKQIEHPLRAIAPQLSAQVHDHIIYANGYAGQVGRRLAMTR